MWPKWRRRMLNLINFQYREWVRATLHRCTLYVVLIQVELEVESLNRRLRLVDDELEQSQSRLHTTQDKLLETNRLADETDRWLVLDHIMSLDLEVLPLDSCFTDCCCCWSLIRGIYPPWIHRANSPLPLTVPLPPFPSISIPPPSPLPFLPFLLFLIFFPFPNAARRSRGAL